MGNTKPGDGPRYKGRGLLQLTGRANYRRFGKLLDLDLEGDPETAADPKISLQIACEYWKDRKINPDCDADNLTAVTRKVNGGLNGLQDRRGFLVKAKAALVRLEGIAVLGNAPRGAKPALRRGSSGDAVEALQETLRKLDFPIAIDADFGAATELAVMKFQAAAGLKPDGIVGPQTMAAIEKAAK